MEDNNDDMEFEEVTVVVVAATGAERSNRLSFRDAIEPSEKFTIQKWD